MHQKNPSAVCSADKFATVVIVLGAQNTIPLAVRNTSATAIIMPPIAQYVLFASFKVSPSPAAVSIPLTVAVISAGYNAIAGSDVNDHQVRDADAKTDSTHLPDLSMCACAYSVSASRLGIQLLACRVATIASCWMRPA